MAFEHITAEVALLVNQMNNDLDDHREMYLVLTEQIGELRAFGMTPPADLLNLEKALRAELTIPRKPH